MNNKTLFEELLYSENEDSVLSILESAGYSIDDDDIWVPLGQNAGNFSTVGNQSDNAAAALVEKVVNSIDAVLMGECQKRGEHPESRSAPSSMQEAVERFFEVDGGRLENLSATQQTRLADRIHVVATGEKKRPCYCIIDRGEGQTPDQFPTTFLSTTRSSPKIRVNFVQGKFNAGGSGSLQFCGQHNIQLIVSRRQPYALPKDDPSGGHWGFTIIRRQRPRAGERSSVFVYLAPQGKVLRFQANALKLLPGPSSQNSPPPAYATEMEYGTAVKLYNYQWTGRGIATLEARRQLERVLHSPCLPFRVTETREYRANYYATTVVGVWNQMVSAADGGETQRNMEPGFPAAAKITLRGIGDLPMRIGVWKKQVKTRHVPIGVFFVVNGQVHGDYQRDFVSRRLKFDYIRDYILVAVDCTNINRTVFEDLFMAARDRLRKNQQYSEIREVLARELSSHQGLRDLNAARRKERAESAGDASSEIMTMINDLIRSDPGLAHLFGASGRIITSVGPGIGTPYKGREFPTYFRLTKAPKSGTLKKRCPVNRTVTVEFETDAVNDYFDRAACPGEIEVHPGTDLIEASNLWNGRFKVRFRVPWDARPGDITNVRFSVTDIQRVAQGPFISTFDLVAIPSRDKPTTKPNNGSGPTDSPDNPRGDKSMPSLRLPTPIPIKKAQWSADIGIEGPFDAFRAKNSDNGGYDFFVNEDCAWLLTETSAKNNDPALVKHWFTWGLALGALGMIRQLKENESEPDLDTVGKACDGLARVIVPMFRVLHQGPPQET